MNTGALVPSAAVIPEGTERQQRFERWLFARICRPFRWTRTPLGIRYVVPGSDGLVVYLDDDVERIRDILANVLPFSGDEHPDEVFGVPGLRLSPWERGRVRLSLAGEVVSVTLAGFPMTTWTAAWREVEAGLAEVEGLRRYWCESPGELHREEREFLAAWDTRDAWSASWWLASGILRRLLVFAGAKATAGASVPAHVEAWSYHPVPGEEWVLEVLCSEPLRQHAEITALLVHPEAGLPLTVARVECYCGESERSCKVHLVATAGRVGSLQIQFNRRKYRKR